jgi:1-deoxy-D-xylulose-5-phosphate synthase
VRRGGKEVLRSCRRCTTSRARRGAREGHGLPGTLFEEFGFNYIGPIDGHDLDALVPHARNVRDLAGPQFLHVITRKGQGYKLAEADPILYHGVGQVRSGEGIVPKAAAKPTYTQVFGDWLCDMAARRPRWSAITPAMREGSGLVRFEREFPERYFDVGIAEQHAVTFAAGLACEGMKPVVAIYSTFLQRGYDQLIHDVALQNLPVVFALDRAGLVGADGATHIGAFDLSYLRCLPEHDGDGAGRRERVPADAVHRLHARRPERGALSARQRPRASRSTRTMHALPVGKGEVRRAGRTASRDARLRSMLAPALAAAEALDATVANMRFVKPLDVDLSRASRASTTRWSRSRRTWCGRRRQRLSPRRWPRPASRCRCCTWACPTASSTTATRPAAGSHVGLDAAGIAASVRARFGARAPGRSRSRLRGPNLAPP